MLFAFLFMLAQATPPASPAAGGDGPPGYSPFIMFGLLAVLAYLFLFRPAQRQEKDRQAMVSALKTNDRVITSGGIIGIVAAIKEKENEVTLNIEEGKVKVTKSSIVQVLKTEEPSKDVKENGE